MDKIIVHTGDSGRKGVFPVETKANHVFNDLKADIAEEMMRRYNAEIQRRLRYLR